MPIGDSKGAFYQDEFRQIADPWFIDPKMEGDESMVKTPNQVETNRQLDKAELDPTTGLGLDVSYKFSSSTSAPSDPIGDFLNEGPSQSYSGFRKAEVDDRRTQSLKEKDNAMVEDLQLPPISIGMENDIFSELSKALGTTQLDEMERNNIVAAVVRGMKKSKK